MKLPIVAFVLVGVANAHVQYMSKIPNAGNVTNPCGSGSWPAVGHTQPTNNGRAQNPFGKDFGRLGHRWSTELCQMDSDQDGDTNGFELGDPDCTWSEGKTPSGPAKGHPGICKDLTSEPCRSQSPCKF